MSLIFFPPVEDNLVSTELSSVKGVTRYLQYYGIFLAHRFAMSSEMQMVLPEMLNIDEPLLWDIYDAEETLLLAKGCVIETHGQLSRLAGGTIMVKLADMEAVSEAEKSDRPVMEEIGKNLHIFKRIELFSQTLVDAFQMIQIMKSNDAIKSIINLGLNLQYICDKPGKADILLAALQLSNSTSYELIHPLHTAALCSITARHLGFSEKATDSIVNSALTANLGLLSHQESFDRAKGGLSIKQWYYIHQHPEVGMNMLKEAGLEDEAWLDAVLHHHEAMDGSGYPECLKADKISQPVRLLTIADSFSAMIRPRSYRKAKLAKAALKDLFDRSKSTIDPDITQSFIKLLGIYPPGTFVALSCGEMGLVSARNSKNPMHPMVSAILKKGGSPYTNPVMRNSGEKGYEIKKILPKDKAAGFIDSIASKVWVDQWGEDSPPKQKVAKKAQKKSASKMTNEQQKIKQEKLKMAASLLDVLDVETIALKTGLSVKEINKL